jgi:UDP-2-acetamido-3-amino-2,3-dideoxy-glucuronate N-acetyltransferase
VAAARRAAGVPLDVWLEADVAPELEADVTLRWWVLGGVAAPAADGDGWRLTVGPREDAWMALIHAITARHAGGMHGTWIVRLHPRPDGLHALLQLPGGVRERWVVEPGAPSAANPVPMGIGDDDAAGARRLLTALRQSVERGPVPFCWGADPWIAHPSAWVDPGADIGPGTRIWHFSHVCAGAVLGARCGLGQNVYVGPGVRLGNGVRVQNNVSIYEGVVAEDDVFLGPSCVLTNVVNPRSHVSRRDEFRTTRLCRGATLGANATVVCGTTVGRYALVGAGAVVTRDVEDFRQVVGNPARPQGWRCACGERVEDAPVPGTLCSRCGVQEVP